MRYQIKYKNNRIELYDTKVPGDVYKVAQVTKEYHNIRTLEILTQILNATQFTINTGEVIELSDEECTYRGEGNDAENELSTTKNSPSGNDSPS